jgi:ankyrin repeat protein
MPATVSDIFKAIDANDVAAVRAAIESAPNLINARDAKGFTPLHIAAADGRGAIVKELIEHEADVKATTTSQVTPLHSAAAAPHGDPEIVKMLLDHGAEIDAKAFGNRTPLHSAAQNGRPEVLQALLDRGAAPNARNVAGHTPLDLAVENPGAGQPEIVELLVKRGGQNGEQTAQAGIIGLGKSERRHASNGRARSDRNAERSSAFAARVGSADDGGFQRPLFKCGVGRGARFAAGHG